MKLLTKALRKKLPPLYAQDAKGEAAIVYAKFFTPDANWEWYITEGGPIYAYKLMHDQPTEEVDYHFFGLVVGQYTELGYFSLRELETVLGPLRLPIERDLHWKPMTLGQVRRLLVPTT